MIHAHPDLRALRSPVVATTPDTIGALLAIATAAQLIVDRPELATFLAEEIKDAALGAVRDLEE